MLYRKFSALACALSLALIPLLGVRAAAAGGEITGTVTDPKGAVVVGAQVTATDAAGKTSTATTDAEGRFKLTGLAPGAYAVVVAARGFAEARVAQVNVADGRAARADVQLQVSLEAGSVNVTAGAAGVKIGRGDAVYQGLRNSATAPDSFTTYASVNNLVLKRDAGTFTLRSGELYFIAPVEDRTVGAVFVGDGEFALTPPVEHEKASLKLFTGEPSITEQFTKLTLRFTDKTFEEVKASPNAKFGTGGPQADRAREIFKENQSLLRQTLRLNFELRALVDLYAPQRHGFFVAFIGGKRFEKLIFQMDPLGIPAVSPEEVLLASYGQSDGGLWTAFHLTDEYRSGKATSREDHRLYDITHHDIDAQIKGTRLVAADRVTLRPLQPGLRVLPFSLFQTLRVSRVADEQGRDLQFIQEGRDRDADFGVILAEPLETGKTYKLTIEYAGGDAISDAGAGNYFLVPRDTWYPNNDGTQFGDRAIFNMTFRYPKGSTFVGTGAPDGQPNRDGDIAVAKWTSGQTELAVAGFNYGRFKTKEVVDSETKYKIEFYANEELPDFLRNLPTIGTLNTTGMADSMIADTQNAVRIYNAYFGKIPYERFAMTQQPAGNFGQAWPTLIYMPFLAFMDSTQRYSLLGSQGAGINFWKYVGPHEVAHEWWGHTIGWTSYRDQWMSEGFAEFSTSLYVQLVRGQGKYIDFWKEQRDQIVQATPATRDRRPYTVGPVTQGYRLNSAKTGAVFQSLAYPKGAYILHMLRMMMQDPDTGDKRFMAMMHDFIKTHYNKDVSTEDFKRVVQKHMTPEMNLRGDGSVDWFFDEWVYGTEMPSYRLEYQTSGNTLSGRITQSGVSDNFVMNVPLYADFGKGWVRLGAATIRGNKTIEIPGIQLPSAPKKAAVAALHDVLALSVENVKR